MKKVSRTRRKVKRWNFKMSDGTFLSANWFEWVNDFNEGFARVQRKDEMWNFIKPDGTLSRMFS